MTNFLDRLVSRTITPPSKRAVRPRVRSRFEPPADVGVARDLPREQPASLDEFNSISPASAPTRTPARRSVASRTPRGAERSASEPAPAPSAPSGESPARPARSTQFAAPAATAKPAGARRATPPPADREQSAPAALPRPAPPPSDRERSAPAALPRPAPAARRPVPRAKADPDPVRALRPQPPTPPRAEHEQSVPAALPVHTPRARRSSAADEHMPAASAIVQVPSGPPDPRPRHGTLNARPLVVAAPVTATVVHRSPPAGATPGGRRSPAVRHAADPERSEQAEHVVHVTIGRLEVRAGAPAGEPPRDRTPSRRSAVALDDYLRERSEGRRR